MPSENKSREAEATFLPSPLQVQKTSLATNQDTTQAAASLLSVYIGLGISFPNKTPLASPSPLLRPVASGVDTRAGIGDFVVG